MPIAACGYIAARRLTVGPDAWIFGVGFLASFSADVAVKVVAGAGNNWWVIWPFAPFELVLMAFAVNRSAMAVVLPIVVLAITDGIMLELGVATLDKGPPLTTTVGWTLLVFFSLFRGNRSLLLRKAVLVYAIGSATVFTVSRFTLPGGVGVFLTSWWFFQFSKFLAISLLLVELGILRLPATGLAILSPGQSLTLDRGRAGSNRVATLVEQLVEVLGPHLLLLPEKLRAEIKRFVESPSSIATVGELVQQLGMDRRFIERAHKYAGLPTPLRFQKLLQLAHAKAMLGDDPDRSLESIARELNTEVRAMRRSAESMFGVGLDEFLEKVRMSQIVATMVYSDRSISRKRRDSGKGGEPTE